MLRKLALVAVVVGLLLLAGAVGLSRMTTTVTVGSGAISLIQSGPVVESAVPLAGGPSTATLATPSASGTLLMYVIGAPTFDFNITSPPGWVNEINSTDGALGSQFLVLLYPNNPGGISAVSIQHLGPNAAVTWYGQLSEWSNVSYAGLGDRNVQASATSGTTFPLSAPSPISHPGSLVIAGWAQGLAGAATATFTSPGGYTRLVDNGALSRNLHLDVEYQVNPGEGTLAQPILSSSQTTASASAGLFILYPGATATDMSPYLRNDSMQFKLNTGDFGLVLGGKLQLEDGSGFLQLEDGSGVYLLDTYIPQLGDPVTVTNPTWSGRVVSTNVHDLDDVLTNYRLVDVTATNTTSAPGGSAPGDFSDVPFGQYILQEDGLSKILLEDGSGSLELEGTSVGYRSLQVQKSQNIDGTVTVYGSLTTFQSGFAAGQVIGLTSQNQGYSGNQFTITNVTNTWMDQLPVFVVEFGDAYQTLQTAGGGVLTKIGSQAGIQAGINMPAGTLGYAQLTDATGLAGLPNLTDITGLTNTVTIVNGRRIHVRGFVTYIKHTAGLLALDLYEGATLLSQWIITAADGASYTAHLDCVLTPTAGVHTYKLVVGVSAGTADVTPSTTLPNFIWVQDVGT